MKKFAILASLISTTPFFSQARFIDNDTIEVTGTGKPQKSGSKLKDEAYCKEAGKIAAMNLAVQMLVEKSWPNVKGRVKREAYENSMTTTVHGAMTGVKVLKATYNGNENPVSCQVTIQIPRMNLSECQENALERLLAPNNETDSASSGGGTVIQVKKGIAKHENISYPVIAKVKTVQTGQHGGIEYNLTEKSEKAALTKAKAVMKFYQGKSINKIKVGKFAKVGKPDTIAWYGVGKKKDSMVGVVVKVIENQVYIYILPDYTEGVLTMLF